MAADVNTMNSTPGQFSRNASSSFRMSKMRGGGAGGQFRATELWNNMIAHLRSEVAVKRRRLKMKTYDSCFTGTDAVDVVLGKLQDERLNFSKEINRDKALKLCKLLMENNVFESVSGKSNGEDSKTEFDDSATKLFRFVHDECKENQDMKEADQSVISDTSDKSDTMSQSSLCIGEADESTASRHSHLVQELMDITGAWKRHSAECLKKITPGKLFARRGSASSECETPRTQRHKLLPPTVPSIEEQHREERLAVQQETRQEVVIGRLLTLVELPILDGILSFDCMAPSPHANRQTLAYSNLAFKRHESMSSLFEQKDDDLWLEAATDLLECCPRGADVLDLSFTEDTDLIRKRRMFNAIAEYYASLTPALWSEHFTDLQVALLNLLMQGRRGKVFQALQLSMMLLPSHVQEELYRILSFMGQARDPVSGHTLSPKMSNECRLEAVFTSAVIKNKVLAPQQAAQLVWYMVDLRESIFSVPPDVQNTIHARLENIVHGRCDTHMELTYCYQVTDEEFRRQQLDNTQDELVGLMNSILDNTALTLREKKQRLKQFSKHHPTLHAQFFADMH